MHLLSSCDVVLIRYMCGCSKEKLIRIVSGNIKSEKNSSQSKSTNSKYIYKKYVCVCFVAVILLT